jgi:hypothetical protein
MHVQSYTPPYLFRIFVGSNSKYCVEHAKCNVLIVKGDWAPPEIHSDLSQVIKEEEEERKRRMDELQHKMEELKVKHDSA